VSRIAYKKGPYFAEEGDFSSAGAADIDYYTKMPRGVASLGIAATATGARWRRIPSMPARAICSTASSCFTTNGPWINPEDYRKLNGVLRFSEGTNADGYTMFPHGLHRQVERDRPDPQRAVTTKRSHASARSIRPNGGKTSALQRCRSTGTRR